MAFLRQQKGLMPLFICGFGGSIFVTCYIARLLLLLTMMVVTMMMVVIMMMMVLWRVVVMV